MITFRDILRNNLIYNGLISKVRDIRISPKLSDVLYSSASELSSLTNTINYSVKMYDAITKSNFENITDRIIMWYKAITLSTTEIVRDFEYDTSKYIKICKRLINNMQLFSDKADELLSFICRKIDNDIDKYKKNTTCMSIGSFTILPFYYKGTTFKNIPATITIFTTESLIYTNSTEMLTIPNSEPVIVKYQPVTEQTVVNVNIALEQTSTNMIYIKTSGDILSITMTAYLNGIVQYKSTVSEKEALFNFKSIDVSAVSFSIKIVHYNTKKYASFQVDNIYIFTNMIFPSSGTFESKNIKLDTSFGINKIGLSAQNYNLDSRTNIDKYISMTYEENRKSFVYTGATDYTNVTVYENTNTEPINLTLTVRQNDKYIIEATSAANPLNSIYQTFFKKTYTPGDAIFNINFKTAKLLIGTNDAFGTTESSLSPTSGTDIYENWTNVGNAYKTMLLNYEPNVSIDIGSNIIKINNREVTGQITIPIGIYQIEVHESLFDINFGKSNGDTNNYIYDFQNIRQDPLFPNNFAYKLAGLPGYKLESGRMVIDDKIILADKSITGTRDFQLDTSFIPLSVSVISNSGYVYQLHLGQSPINKGTFTIEPVLGKIRVSCNGTNDGNDIITISYQRAERGFKPAGILFNRLGRYLKFKSIYSLMSQLGMYDDTFFTLIGDNLEKSILIADVSNKYIYHTKLLYSDVETDVYAACKFVLQTKDKELTPIIKDIYIEGAG